MKNQLPNNCRECKKSIITILGRECNHPDWNKPGKPFEGKLLNYEESSKTISKNCPLK